MSEDQGNSGCGLRNPGIAGVARSEVEMLMDLCAVKGAWAVDARGVCEADPG